MTVYPVGACIPGSGRPVEAVDGALPTGKGLLIADGWYNYGGYGYLPLIRPYSNRYDGGKL